jgi:hypothetical protein
VHQTFPGNLEAGDFGLDSPQCLLVVSHEILSNVVDRRVT